MAAVACRHKTPQSPVQSWGTQSGGRIDKVVLRHRTSHSRPYTLEPDLRTEQVAARGTHLQLLPATPDTLDRPFAGEPVGVHALAAIVVAESGSCAGVRMPDVLAKCIRDFVTECSALVHMFAAAGPPAESAGCKLAEFQHKGCFDSAQERGCCTLTLMDKVVVEQGPHCTDRQPDARTLLLD